jgi:predicted acyl esterase
MADGIRLNATLYRPDGEGPWPAILEALPYRKDDITASYRPEYVRLAEAGYVVCRVDVRGTGTSEGLPTDEYPAEERTDLVAVIDWLATQDWSTGTVGMYGTSYSGFNSIQIAMERPPALKAIIPIFATDDRFADDVHYFGGALKQLDQIDYPTYMVAMNALPPVPAIFGEGWREEWEHRVQTAVPWIETWLEHQRYDDYWKFGSLLEDYGAIEAATMIVAGWADGYTNNSLRTLERLGCSKRLILGPWAHASTETSVPGPNIDLVPEMVRWWDRWLKGVDNGIDREPEIVLFARRSTKISPHQRQIRGEWRFEPTWPLDRLAPKDHRLTEASGPPGDGPDVLEVRGDVGWTGWISCAGYFPYGQPDDQRPDEAYSLVYDWPVPDELEILGHPVLEVTITSSAPIAYLSAKLCDVFPDGYSSLVTRGLLNLAHRDSREQPEPLEPGVPVRVRFPLEVTSWIFEPGHRIRLDLAGADWPNTWAPPEPTTLTVERDGALLELPVLDGPPATTEVPVISPVEKPTTLDRREASGRYGWRIEHDVATRETRAEVGAESDNAPDGDVPSFADRYEGTVGVSTEDPGRAFARGVARFEIRWPEATVASEVHTSLTSDRDTYRLEIDLHVEEGGEERWHRTWERTIPRDHQ